MSSTPSYAKALIKRLIHESNLIEGFDDPAFDTQGMVAWEHLLTVSLDKLTGGDVRKVQKIVTLKQKDMRPDLCGYWRKIPVYIGGREAIKPAYVERAMAGWLEAYKHLPSIAAHIDFEKVHPFVDGNGRTGRLLLWWMQMRRGEDLSEITYEDRIDYYQWFQ